MSVSDCCALLCAACAGFVAAETRQERASAWINEALQALGGDAFLPCRTAWKPVAPTPFTARSCRPVHREDLYPIPRRPCPARFASASGRPSARTRTAPCCSPENGGMEITFRGARPLETALQQLRTARVRNILYILRQRLKEPGLIFYSHGSDIWENRPVEIVDITDADNLTVRSTSTSPPSCPSARSSSGATGVQGFEPRRPSSPSTATSAAASSGRSPSGGSATARRSSRCIRTRWRSTRI